MSWHDTRSNCCRIFSLGVGGRCFFTAFLKGVVKCVLHFIKSVGKFMLNCVLFSFVLFPPESYAFDLMGRFENGEFCPPVHKTTNNPTLDFQSAVRGTFLLALLFLTISVFSLFFNHHNY